MKTTYLLAAAGFATTVILSAWLASSSAQTAPPPAVGNAKPTAIVVADPVKIFDELQERRDMRAELTTKATKLQDEETKRQKNIQDLENSLNMVAGNPTEFARVQAELEQKVMETKVWREWESAKMQREEALQMERLYKKCVDAVGRVAQQNGADLVLFKEQPASFKGADPRALPTLIQMRKVLWAADNLDITNQVILLMNNEYNNKAGATTRP